MCTENLFENKKIHKMKKKSQNKNKNPAAAEK